MLAALSLETAGDRVADPRPPPAPGDAAVLEAVGWDATGTEEVLARTGLGPAQAAMALAHLEQQGWIRRPDGCAGGWWERAAAP